jgi:hypothetical protein
MSDRFGDFKETVVAAGNGGTANATANGGSVSLGDVSFGNTEVAYSAATEGDGNDGGDVFVSNGFGISADGGLAVADASGGDYNIAFVS